MITVTITQKDGQLWICYFDYTAQAEAWIAEEQTRPYWSNYSGYTITGTDKVN